ncbi:hypothetical protein DL767_003121 [Monosporascus sp. MG133]|nr:hypothetical protein DL767_003121 [Monosporascus sp. MG133]
MTVSYDQLVWCEASPGLWQRAVDEVERFYAALTKLYEGSGRNFFAMTGHISLEVGTAGSHSREDVERRIEDAVRKGWVALRYDHPTIASRVVQDPGTGKFSKIYRTSKTDVQRDQWLENTVKVVSKGQTGMERANSDPPVPGLPTLFIIRPPPSSTCSRVVRRDLVLRSPHDIVDGIGTLYLFGNLLDHVSSCECAAGAYQAQLRRLSDNAAQNAAAAEGDESLTVLGIPFKPGATLPGKHQRIAVTFSKEQTSRLLAACKAAAATVTHIFHAATAIVVRDIQERPPTTSRVRYVNYILKNERASCVEPYNTSKHAVAAYHSVSGKSLTVDMAWPGAGDSDASQESGRKKEFLGAVQIMKDFYDEVRNDSEHYALVPSIFAAGTPALPSPATGPPPVPPPKTKPSVSISSIGRIDPIIKPTLGDFEVYSPWVTGEELGNGLGLFLGTYRGELCLSAAYNDAWHDEEEVFGFLKHCEHVVFRGLSIG